MVEHFSKGLTRGYRVVAFTLGFAVVSYFTPSPDTLLDNPPLREGPVD